MAGIAIKFNPAKVFHGKPCKECGGTLRYIKGESCIMCAGMNARKNSPEPKNTHVLEWPRATALVKGQATYVGLDCGEKHGGLRYTCDRICVQCARFKKRDSYRSKMNISSRCCLKCGKTFVPVHMAKGFCSIECRRQRKRQQSRESHTRLHPPNPPKPPKIPKPLYANVNCSRCGKAFLGRRWASRGNRFCSSDCKQENRNMVERDRHNRARAALTALEELGIKI